MTTDKWDQQNGELEMPDDIYADEGMDRSGGMPAAVRGLLAGLAGAVTVTLLNEGVRRVLPHAPRMDVIGERALAGTLRAADIAPPTGRALYRWSMLGDVVSNTSYYSLVGLLFGKRPWTGGSLLGVAAGLGAAFLPRPLGLGKQPGARTPRTPLLTVAWYTAGGLAAAGVDQALRLK